MRFRIRHATTYRYDRPVVLGRHVFRMHPRPDGFLKVDAFELSVYPRPAEVLSLLDLEGNLTQVARFEGEAQELRVAVVSTGVTSPRPSPAVDAEWASLPLHYAAEQGKMDAYLRLDAHSGIVEELSRDLARETGRETLPFLEALNKRLYENIRNVPRLMGDPLEPQTTLREGKGSCRDFATLFIACCRHQGVAARFVSGYVPAQPGDRQHMHAWAEVYLPGMGWQAYDPTQGGGAGETHVAVAAAAEPPDASPIAGLFQGLSRSEMFVDLTVEMTESSEQSLRSE